MYPIKVTIRDIPKSHVLEDHILKKATKLNQFCQRISGCRIVVDMPQKHKHQGKLFRVSIELNVQGKELVVNRKLNEDIYIAIVQAFDAIERKLEEYSHRRINNIRRRKRAANGNNYIEDRRHDDPLSTAVNDVFYMDEVDSEYEDVTKVMRDENIWKWSDHTLRGGH